MIKIITNEELELKKLTTDELKQIVNDGITGAINAGYALLVMRDEKRWLEKPYKYKSFKEFVSKEFEHSRQMAYNLMQGAEAVKSLPIPTRKLVKNAAAAKALSNIKLPERKKVVEQAAKNSKTGQATASGIRKASPQPEPPKRKALLDKEGVEVPQEIEELWTRGRNEMSELVDDVSRLIGRYECYERENEILFAEVGKGMGNLVAKLKSVRQETELAIPHTVCPSCNGVLECEKCTTCKGRGFISKFYFQTHVASDHIRKQGKP